MRFRDFGYVLLGLFLFQGCGTDVEKKILRNDSMRSNNSANTNLQSSDESFGFYKTYQSLPKCKKTYHQRVRFVVDQGQFYVCLAHKKKWVAIKIKGEQGEKGDPGHDGLNITSRREALPPGNEACPEGGFRYEFGLDYDRNGSLSDDEVDWDLTMEICHGARGDQGAPGEKGEKGDRGESGERGEKGDQGEKGEKGDKGDKGDQGDKGDPGENGRDGEDGDTGQRGPRGETGQNGSSCSVVNNEETGEIKIVCDDGSEAILRDGL